ncbi:unnamed protein product [Owenia fusiformis]|nr:unnamed protein product [Owenia fusiformis]
MTTEADVTTRDSSSTSRPISTSFRSSTIVSTIAAAENTVSSTVMSTTRPCSLSANAWRCVFDLAVEYANATEKTINKVCHTIPYTRNCVEVNMAGCGPLQTTVINRTLEMLLAELQPQCPPCEAETALRCIQNFTSEMFGIVPWIDGACKSIDDVRTCIRESTPGCQGNLSKVLNTTAELQIAEIMDFCNETENSTLSYRGMRCYKCDGAANNTMCNIFIEQCTYVPDRQFCYTSVDADENGRLTKGCTSPSTCWPPHGQCVGPHCKHCCQGMLCNEPESGYQPCRAEKAQQCTEQLSKDIDEYGHRLDEWNILCCDKLPETTRCIEESKVGCNSGQIAHIDNTFNVVRRQLGPDKCYWMRVLNQGRKVHNNSGSIVLDEGGPPEYLNMTFQCSPTQICQAIANDHPDCQVMLNMNVEDPTGAASPKCMTSGDPISQVIIGKHDFQFPDSSCVLSIHDHTYNKPHLIPLVATIDLKYDGDQERNLSLNLNVNLGGSEHRFESLTIKVIARDMDTQAMCKSINDPHITTFDNHYYNNHLEGYFTLYKHMELPYEVQVIYQRCTAGQDGTCNCAVAIRSGDSVLVIDRCRRNVTDWRREYNINIMNVTLFIYKDLTPATRFFQRADGFRYEVLFPHGTQVRVAVNEQLINVWVIPSPADWKNTMGLCGLYNGNSADDLMLPNGTIYSGEGDQPTEQPMPFLESWRVNATDRIFSGAKERDRYRPESYCDCAKPDIHDPRARKCGYDVLVSTCDIDTDGELTANMDYGKYLTIVDLHKEDGVQRFRRQAIETTEDGIDVDENYRPPSSIGWSGDWNETTAREFCDYYLTRKFPIGQACTRVPNVKMEGDIETCVEDIKLTNSTSWASSPLESIQTSCRDQLSKNITYASTDEGRAINENIDSMTCVNQCSGRGNCTNGQCECEAEYIGADCSMPEYQAPIVAVIQYSGICDYAIDNCSTIELYGKNFVDSPKLTCHMEYVTVTPSGEGFTRTGTVTTRQATYINFQAIRCDIPTLYSSFKIRVSNNGVNASSQEPLLLLYNSSCQSCSNRSPSPQCSIFDDRCVIDSRCYHGYTLNPDNSCFGCYPQNKTFWSPVDVEARPDCRALPSTVSPTEGPKYLWLDKYLLIGICVGVTVVLFLGTLVIIYVVRQGKRTRERKINGEAVFRRRSRNNSIDSDDVNITLPSTQSAKNTTLYRDGKPLSFGTLEYINEAFELDSNGTDSFPRGRRLDFENVELRSSFLHHWARSPHEF